MREIRLSCAIGPQEAAKFAGKKLDESSFDFLFEDEDVRVFKPDGSLLLCFRAKAVAPALCQQAHSALREAAGKTNNRGIAAGFDGEEAKARTKRLKADGSRSNTSVAYGGDVESGVVGFFDRYTRIPFCRQTAFTRNFPARLAAARPMIEEIDRVFRESVPDRYAAQKAVADRTHPDFRIGSTAFTTVTVNRNWQTAVHQDAGDLKEGFGVLTASRFGEFSGGYFVLPAFRVAVNMKLGDVLLADVHEWHGNTPIRGLPGRFERVSFVLYYRQNMHRCGSAAQELERAKSRVKGMPLYD